MTAETLFQPLGPADDPALGLFYFESEAALEPLSRVNNRAGRPSAAGMGWLVGSDGLVATCSHVILFLDSAPGQRLSLYGATHSVSLEVKAEVCSGGWTGPELDEEGRRRRHPFWQELWDGRPDVFKEDIAFLRILPESARWHIRSERSKPADPASAYQALVNNARVLPFSAAGYRCPGAHLKAWCVNWYQGAPDCQAGDAYFRSMDKEAHHAVRMSTETLRKGFSGSPLWDSHRRTVVGMVRRTLPALNGLMLGTDARSLMAHPGIRAVPDRRLRAIEARLLARLAIQSPGAYGDTTGVHSDAYYIEPEVDLVAAHDPLDPVQKHDFRPAIEFLVSSAGGAGNLVLRGGAGIGKTALLGRIAARLLHDPQYVDGLRVLPFLLTANELVRNNLDLARCLEDLWIAVRPADALNENAIDVLADNAVTLIILLDGLDEIPLQQQRSVLARLNLASRKSSKGSLYGTGDLEDVVASAIIASRPSDAVRLPEDPDKPLGFGVLDLCGFDASAVQSFCNTRFADSQTRDRFLHELEKLRWTSGRVPPLQLQMAASLFSWDEDLPSRVIDLPAQFVEHLVERGREDFLKRIRDGLAPPDEVTQIYLPAVNQILDFAAEVTLRSGAERLTRIEFQKALREWLVTTTAPDWARNVGSVTEFLFGDFSASVPILSVARDDNATSGIGWAHRTFAELLASQHLYRINANNVPALSAQLHQHLTDGDHVRALSLLGVMDRGKRTDAVAHVLVECMRQPVKGARPQLFSVRALASGIDANGQTREAQVALLVRILVSNAQEGMYCRQVFSPHDYLPDAKEILSYAELRADIYKAMLRRFSHRLARSTPRRPPVVLVREAQVLDYAGLWPDFIDMGLKRPAPQTGLTVSDRFTEAAPFGPGVVRSHGQALIAMADATGAQRSYSLPVDDFVSALATAARGTHATVPSARLVELAVALYYAALERGSARSQEFGAARHTVDLDMVEQKPDS